jgi:hypothetical protein
MSSRSASKVPSKHDPIREEALAPLIGRKHVKVVAGYLARLRELYPHPNRELFYDDVIIAYLLAFFNPAVRSLRTLEDLTRLPKARDLLRVKAVCRSTLSEANALFDPAHLQGLIGHLRSQLPRLKQQDPDLKKLLEQLVCLDGSYFRVAADVQWALWNHKAGHERRHVRLNCAYAQATGTPLGVSVSGDDGTGEGTQALKLIHKPPGARAADKEQVPAQQIFVFDSGVVSFELLTGILQQEDHFVCNLRDQVNFACQEERSLDEQARAAGVTSDRVGRLTGSQCHQPPEALVRELILPYTDRQGRHKHVRLLTDLVDLPAHLLAALYRYRWQIELFFRWLKVHAAFRRLMSFSPNGMTIGFYIAVIGAMLLCVNSGQPLNKYALNLFGMVACGMASPADVLPILQRRAREKQLEKERLARKKAAQKG